ncbi:MAG: DMT family transporter [Candidatus Hodarchaeales archaeon]
MIDDSRISKGFWITNLIMVAFFWGLTFVFVKNALNDISVLMFLVIRFSFATGIMISSVIIISVLRDRSGLAIKLKTSFTRLMHSRGWFLGAVLYGSFIFQTFGLDLTTPANTAFITGLNVIFVPIIVFFSRDSRLQLSSVFSAILGISGLAMLTLDFDNLVINIGDMLVLFTAVLVAIHIIGTDRLTKTEPVNYLVLSQFISMSLISVAVALVLEPGIFIATVISLDVYITSPVIVALFLTVIFATIFAFTIQTLAQEREISPLVIALIFALEPVFALVSSVYFGEEQLTLMKLAGMTVIFIAIVLSIIKSTDEN